MKKTIINIAMSAGVVVLALTVAIVAWVSKKPAAANETKPPIPVDVVAATLRPMSDRLRAKGVAQSVDTAEISPKLSGILTSLIVKEGDAVERGQIVATLDKTQLLFAKRNSENALAQAVAGKATADIGENSAQIGLEQAKISAQLAAAQINVALATIAQSDAAVKQAAAGKQTADASLRVVELDYNRIKNLLEQNAASKQQFDHVEVQFDAAKAALLQAEQRTLQAASDAAKAQEMLAVAELQKRQAEQQILAAEAGRLMAKEKQVMAQSAVDQATIGTEIAKTNLNDSDIRSPMTGIITSKRLKLGEQASPGKAVYEIKDMSVIEIKFTVASVHLEKISLGLAADIRIDGVPSTIRGAISDIAPTIDERQRSVELTVRIENAGGRIKPGAYASVEIIIAAIEDSVAIPRELVFSAESNPYVYVIQNATAVRTPVTLGMTDGAFVQISSGVRAGDAVAATGRNRLTDGAKVILEK